MLKIDLHIHTVKSPCGFNTILEIIEEAAKRKMKAIGITDHGPSGSGPSKAYFNLGYRLPDTVCGLRLLFGVELNVIDSKGSVDLEERIVKKMKVVLAGIHQHAGLSGKNTAENTSALLNVMQNPYVQIITHAYYSDMPVDIERVAEEACKRGKLMELNAASFKYPHKMDENALERAKKMIAVVRSHRKKIIVNSDSHVVFDLGEDSRLMSMQKELGFTAKDVINNYPDELNEYVRIQ